MIADSYSFNPGNGIETWGIQKDNQTSVIEISTSMALFIMP